MAAFRFCGTRFAWPTNWRQEVATPMSFLVRLRKSLVKNLSTKFEVKPFGVFGQQQQQTIENRVLCINNLSDVAVVPKRMLLISVIKVHHKPPGVTGSDQLLHCHFLSPESRTLTEKPDWHPPTQLGEQSSVVIQCTKRHHKILQSFADE